MICFSFGCLPVFLPELILLVILLKVILEELHSAEHMYLPLSNQVEQLGTLIDCVASFINSMDPDINTMDLDISAVNFLLVVSNLLTLE